MGKFSSGISSGYLGKYFRFIPTSQVLISVREAIDNWSYDRNKEGSQLLGVEMASADPETNGALHGGLSNKVLVDHKALILHIPPPRKEVRVQTGHCTMTSHSYPKTCIIVLT